MNHSTNLDANATHTPLPGVLEAISTLYSELGNPSSVHTRGQRARALIEDARAALLTLVGAKSSDYRVLFTCGATEALNALLTHIRF